MTTLFKILLATAFSIPISWGSGIERPGDWRKIESRLQSGDFTVLDELKSANRIHDLHTVLKEASWSRYGQWSDAAGKEAKKRLEALPNHEVYIGDQIEELSREKGNVLRRVGLLRSLQRLATPEAVAQLGRFLYDERNPDYEDYDERHGSPPPLANYQTATWSITEIFKKEVNWGIKGGFTPMRDIPRVRTWWESEAGKPYRDLLAASGRGYAGQNPAAPPLTSTSTVTPQAQTGTSVTIPPVTPSLVPVVSSTLTTSGHTNETKWAWWAAGLALLVVVCGWRLFRRRHQT